MIYCVWYPSGGFGHFINGILTLHGNNFAKPVQSELKFSTNGNAHALDLVAPKYQNCRGNYKFTFTPDQNYSVLIDNGINNESTEFVDDFPNACVIKLCYSQRTWPIVARTMIDKAMNSSLEQQLPVNFGDQQSWAVREKYFLFLKNHPLLDCWKPSPDVNNILIDDMLDYQQLEQKLTKVGIVLENFHKLWQEWYQANQPYIDPVILSQEVIHCLKTNQYRNLNDFDTHWSQAVLYYFIHQEFGQEVPHNDYCNFFSDTRHLLDWLKI
jgi:hypothetical protein